MKPPYTNECYVSLSAFLLLIAVLLTACDKQEASGHTEYLAQAHDGVEKKQWLEAIIAYKNAVQADQRDLTAHIGLAPNSQRQLSV